MCALLRKLSAARLYNRTRNITGACGEIVRLRVSRPDNAHDACLIAARAPFADVAVHSSRQFRDRVRH